MNGEGGPGNAYAYRVKLLGNELGYKGPYTYGMEEKEYWDALMSYTVELFSDTPDEVLQSNVKTVLTHRRWYALGKYAKAHPFTMEAAAYRTYDDARRASHLRLNQIQESYHAGLIDSDEAKALHGQNLARLDAVMALTNAFVPLNKLHLMGRKLEFDEMMCNAGSGTA